MTRELERRLAALRDEVEEKGWRVERGSKYYVLKCPCPGKHMKTMHLTPSDPRYELNLRKWLERQPCWGETKEAGQ